MNWTHKRGLTEFRANMSVYVDDCVIVTNNQNLEKQILDSVNKYEYSESDGAEIVGIGIIRVSKHQLHVNMETAIRKLLMMYCSPNLRARTSPLPVYPHPSTYSFAVTDDEI